MSTQNFNGGAILKGRNAPPSHYLLKIDSFSLLSKASIENLIMDEFEAGGFKWKMSIYFAGDKSNEVTDHLSIYLQLSDTNSLPIEWEVNAMINFFMFNQLHHKYFSHQDGTVQNFHATKTRFGIAKFIDLATFSNPLYGFLFNDECVFGAEVFVVKNTSKVECLSMKPSDFPLDLASGMPPDESREKQAMVKQILVSSYNKYIAENLKAELQENDNDSQDQSEDKLLKIFSTAWWLQFLVLLRRRAEERIQESFSDLKIIEVLVVAFLTGLLWWS